MIWSLLKVLIFLALVAVLTLAASYLLDTGGGIVVAVAGYEFTLGPLQAVIVTAVVMALIWLVMRLVGLIVAVLRFLNGDETAISRYFDRNREKKGYQAFAEGMIALASGEPKTALARAARAERYLSQPELTTILTAQAAQAAGDTKRATAAYKALLANPRSRFIGIRGLIDQKLAEGDRETALKLAQKAFELRPRHRETQDLLLELQAESSDWAGARATLGAKLRSGTIPRDLHRRRDAVLALQEAKAIIADGSDIEAREAAIEAHKLSPDLIPAATMAARSYIAKGDTKNATRVLKKAWEANPHPDLAAAFADIAPDENAGRASEALPHADRRKARRRRNPDAAGRTESRRRGFSGRPPRAGRSGHAPSNPAQPGHHGGHRAWRGRRRQRGARLARPHADRAARPAMGL